MELPSIYTQPIADLENFEMNGDSLAVVKDCMDRIKENDAGDPAKNPTSAATHTRTTK